MDDRESVLDSVVAYVIAWGRLAYEIAVRAVFIMFVAAVVAKRTTVFAPIGYMESFAWSMAYALVKGLWRREG